jgi:hypothetical protein
MREGTPWAHRVSMAHRTIELRWHARCCRCLAELGVGETARFDDVSHEITCDDCAAGRPHERPSTLPPRWAPTNATRQRQSELERQRVKALIGEARAALDAARRAG